MSPVDPFDRPVGDDEAEAARMGLDLADHEVHPIGQTVAVAARLNEVAGLDELLQQPGHGRALRRAVS